MYSMPSWGAIRPIASGFIAIIFLDDCRTAARTSSTHGHMRQASLLMGVLITATSNFSATGTVSRVFTEVSGLRCG
jgi:hypothetical protein